MLLSVQEELNFRRDTFAESSSFSCVLRQASCNTSHQVLLASYPPGNSLQTENSLWVKFQKEDDAAWEHEPYNHYSTVLRSISTLFYLTSKYASCRNKVKTERILDLQCTNAAFGGVGKFQGTFKTCKHPRKQRRTLRLLTKKQQWAFLAPKR